MALLWNSILLFSKPLKSGFHNDHSHLFALNVNLVNCKSKVYEGGKRNVPLWAALLFTYMREKTLQLVILVYQGVKMSTLLYGGATQDY